MIAAENVGMKDPQHVSNLRKFTDNYDWSGLKFPVSIKDIEKFENKNNISVNMLAVEGRDIYIRRKSDYKSDREINLLLISEDPMGPASGNDRWHYTSIESLSRLLASKNSKHHGKQHFCMNCLQHFTFELSRDKHYAYCIDNETVKVEMPSKGLTVEFCDGQNQFRVPFLMYVDFKVILEPIQIPSPDPNQPYTSEVNQHIPSGWCVYSKFSYGNVQNPLKLYRGKNCVETFCDHIKREAHRLYHMFPEKPMDSLTPKQWKQYEKTSRCHICFKPFNSKDLK